MTEASRVDVVIFEDRVEEVDRIRVWLGLNPAHLEADLSAATAKNRPAPPVDVSSAIALRPADLKTQGRVQWRHVKAKLVELDPRLVIFDWLLSGDSGDSPFSGLEFAREARDAWENLGVIVVTSGGDGELATILAQQQDLDEQRARHGWRIDAAWVKPWGPGKKLLNPHPTQIDFRAAVQGILKKSLRPSEHPAAG